MSKRDFYEVLGLPKDCSPEDIKKAYRKLAKQYHPDVNKTANAESKFKEAKDAYDVLSDDQKKAQYDQFGHVDPNQGMGDGAPGGFGDIFDMFFGSQTNRRNPNAPQRGSDLQYTTTIEFKEAVFGKEMEVVIPRTENCDTCSGTGAKKGTKPENCSVCKGTGQQDFVQNTAFGRIVNRRVCSACNGQGKLIKEKCSPCNGAGKVKNRRKINIKVPAGVDEGAQIRVTGEGESGTKGGPSGDLYVVIRVKSHEFFEREGSDIFCEIPLTFTQAALGDEIEIPTLTDKVKLKIPAGTQTNTFFRLKGKGVPHLRGYGQGDQNVKVTIVTPTTMTDEQRELLKEFARLSGEHTHSQNQSIFERMKRAILGE